MRRRHEALFDALPVIQDPETMRCAMKELLKQESASGFPDTALPALLEDSHEPPGLSCSCPTGLTAGASSLGRTGGGCQRWRGALADL